LPSGRDTIPALTFSGRASRSSPTENIGLAHMMQLSGTTLTKRNGSLGRLNNAYVGLALMPESGDGSKTITLKRYGDYEVRLIDFSQCRLTVNCLFWLELYCHMTRSSLDSCRCDDLDDAEVAADHLISRAKQLYDDSK
jgi:hypothetical protein